MKEGEAFWSRRQKSLLQGANKEDVAPTKHEAMALPDAQNAVKLSGDACFF